MITVAWHQIVVRRVKVAVYHGDITGINYRYHPPFRFWNMLQVNTIWNSANWWIRLDCRDRKWATLPNTQPTISSSHKTLLRSRQTQTITSGKLHWAPSEPSTFWDVRLKSTIRPLVVGACIRRILSQWTAAISSLPRWIITTKSVPALPSWTNIRRISGDTNETKIWSSWERQKRIEKPL